jgi:hypothetical protein
MPLAQKQSSHLRLSWTGRRMLRWTEAIVSWSDRSTTATHEHASWASPSTRLQLMDGDAQSENQSKNRLGDPGLVAPEDPGNVAAPPRNSLLEALPPAIPAPMVPCGMSSIPGTSAVNASTSHQRVTSANKVWFLSSAQRFLQNPGFQNT